MQFFSNVNIKHYTIKRVKNKKENQKHEKEL